MNVLICALLAFSFLTAPVNLAFAQPSTRVQGSETTNRNAPDSANIPIRTDHDKVKVVGNGNRGQTTHRSESDSDIDIISKQYDSH